GPRPHRVETVLQPAARRIAGAGRRGPTRRRARRAARPPGASVSLQLHGRRIQAMSIRGRVRAERAAWTMVTVRAAIWAGTAFPLLWAPLQGRTISPFRAYEGVTDLLFGTFAQWDSVWFIHIADHGYDSKQITAFFPLYPLLVHGV